MERETEPTPAERSEPVQVGAREPDRGEEQSGFEGHLAEFFRDSALWPVLVAAGGIFVTLGATVLVLAVRERNLFAMAALVIVLVVSADVTIRDLSRRRLGLASGILVALWTLSAMAAYGIVRLGVFGPR